MIDAPSVPQVVVRAGSEFPIVVRVSATTRRIELELRSGSSAEAAGHGVHNVDHAGEIEVPASLEADATPGEYAPFISLGDCRLGGAGTTEYTPDFDSGTYREMRAGSAAEPTEFRVPLVSVSAD